VSSTDILRRYFDRLDDGMRADQLDVIQRSTGTLSGLIEDLLLLGKTEAGRLACHPAPLDLLTLCRHVADEVASATRRVCPIRVEADGDLQGAQADEALLRPAITNLLTNAVKYSPAGAIVSVEIRRRGTEAEIVICDQGIGIPPEDQARLFAAFARASNVGNRPGTGLGLVIAKRCIELHDGRIALASTLGVGTTFTLTLPLFPKQPPAATPATTTAVSASGGQDPASSSLSSPASPAFESS
jgi:signal transduction histidine kinase